MPCNTCKNPFSFYQFLTRFLNISPVLDLCHMIVCVVLGRHMLSLAVWDAFCLMLSFGCPFWKNGATCQVSVRRYNFTTFPRYVISVVYTLVACSTPVLLLRCIYLRSLGVFSACWLGHCMVLCVNLVTWGLSIMWFGTWQHHIGEKGWWGPSPPVSTSSNLWNPLRISTSSTNH